MRAAAVLPLTGVLAVTLSVTAAPAAADPPLPPAPPYIPGDVSPAPGSFSYPYNVIIVPAPAGVDARGVYIDTNVSPSQPLSGLPGSQLGNSPPPPNNLTSSNALYGISAGGGQPPPPVGGVNIGAGNQAAAPEDPSGAPPSTAARPEAAGPTTDVRDPAPALENPRGQPSTTG